MTDLFTDAAQTLIEALKNPDLRKVCEPHIFAAAEEILASKLVRIAAITKPADAGELFRMRIGRLEHEEFHMAFLDNRHRVIAVEMLFRGTVDGASVHPREVVKRALALNAVAVIAAHCHPSGANDPSAADRAITKLLRDALALVDIRLLDHLIVSPSLGATSMATMGCM